VAKIAQKARTNDASPFPFRAGRKAGNSPEDAAARISILSAALSSFSERGFDGASIADIARRHRVSPPLIHYYFKNKADLWRAAAAYGGGEMVHDLEQIMTELAHVDSLDRLKFFVRRHIALMVERTELFRLIIRESETPGPRLKWLLQKYFHPLYTIFEKLVDDAQKEGKIKANMPPYHVCQIIAGACYQFISSRNRLIELYDVDPTTREMRERHANYVVDVLFSGLETSSAASGDMS
jgi:AcrR family transcriptional regulator